MTDHRDPNKRDADDEALLDRAVDAVLREPVPGNLRPDQLTELVAAVQRAAHETNPISLFERIKRMKPMTRVALGASVLIAVAGLMSWLVPHSGDALAFADVADALNNVNSATWKTVTVVKGPNNESHTWSGKGMFLAPSHERTEIAADGRKAITIMDGQKDKVITLDPAAKSATVIQFKNLPAENPFGRTFQGLRGLVVQAQDGKVGKTDRLGVEVIDGRRAEGFHIRLGSVDVKVWADPKTLQPIRVEETTSAPEVRIVMSDFQIGVDLDKSLFSLDIPAGYAVQQTAQMDFSKKPIAYVAEALKLAAECNDGVFPAALLGEQGIDGILKRAAPTLAKQKHLSDAEATKFGTNLAMTLGGAFGFLFALPPDAVHYDGKDVRLNTPNQPIFWYRLKHEAKCTVIYADLSIKEVAPEDAPKLPGGGGPKR
jgi:outer membrane lipoprotein-sorting protein